MNGHLAIVTTVARNVSLQPRRPFYGDRLTRRGRRLWLWRSALKATPTRPRRAWHQPVQTCTSSEPTIAPRHTALPLNAQPELSTTKTALTRGCKDHPMGCSHRTNKKISPSREFSSFSEVPVSLAEQITC